MSQPKKVTQEQYDDLRSKMEEKYKYDEMDDEDKERFDNEFDKMVVVDSEAEDTDQEDTDQDEKGDNEFEDGHPQEHDDGEMVL